MIMRAKLIKKHDLGGIAKAVDSSLDGLGTWGKLGVQVIDPTGITGWKDFGDALKAFQKEGGIRKAGELGLAALGAIPMFGSVKGFSKLLGLSKKVDKVGDISKLARTVKDLPKGIDVATYKKLLDPTVNIQEVLGKLDLDATDLTKLKECVEYSASRYMEAAGKNITSPELVATTKRYEELLTDLDKNIKLKIEEADRLLYEGGEEMLLTPEHAFDVGTTGNLEWSKTRTHLNRKKEREAAEKARKRRKDFIEDNPIIYFP